MDINRENLIWAAGLFEGEGTIRISKIKRKGKYGYNHGLILSMSLTMTDKDCVEKFSEIINGWIGNHHKNENNPKHQPSFICILNSRKAYFALQKLLPHFRSNRMIEKAKLGLEFQEHKLIGTPARDLGYKKEQMDYWQRMKILNLRGAAAKEYKLLKETA